VTTGPIELQTGADPSFLTQESDELLLQESADAILLDDPT